MSKSEKRNFKLMAQKTGDGDKLYVQLFDYIDRYEKFDDKGILKKIPSIKKSQLSNLRAKLSKVLLRALRDINKENYPEIRARERFDFAKVLYAKGQYRESLDMLEIVKNMALQINMKPLLYLAISFEKQIETQHVTKSMSPRAYQLAKESNDVMEGLQLTNHLSNLSLLLYARYLENGYVKNEAEFSELHRYFHSILPVHDEDQLDFYQKLHLYQSYVWFHHMAQDFLNYYKYSQKWVRLFDKHPQMKGLATVLYLKGVHNVLNALFMAGKRRQFRREIETLLQFNTEGEFRLSVNEESQLQLFKFTHGINSVFLSANYAYGAGFVRDLEAAMQKMDQPWDPSRIMVFNYKIACVHFGNGDLDSTITYLNRVENDYQRRLKVDIQCFSRVLNLISHYDLGNDILVSYKIKSVFRFLLKMGELEKVQTEIFNFIRRTPKMSKRTIISEFIKLRDSLIDIENDRFEKRPFLYLDIISWLDSKINQVTMVEAIRNRIAMREQR